MGEVKPARIRGELFGFAVGAVTAAVTAILGKLQAVRVVLLVLLRVVVAALALLAGQHDHNPILFFGHSLVLSVGPT